MKRQDIHRPSAPEFDPAAYQFFGSVDFDPVQGNGKFRVRLVNAALERGYRFGAHGGGTCGHCGTHLRYAALMLHEASKEMIWVGEQCLGNRFELSKAEFKALREEARLNRERVTKAEKIARLCEEFPVLADLTYPEALEGEFLQSVGGQLVSKGELSERQVESAAKAIVRGIAQRAKREVWAAERVAEAAASEWGEEPGTKGVFTGKVRFCHQSQGYYGVTTLLILEAGNIRYKHFLSKEVHYEKGTILEGKGMVKAHETYNGEKQTVLTRVRWKEVG